MAEAEDPLKKLKRRHQRDLRYARAEGLLQGVRLDAAAGGRGGRLRGEPGRYHGALAATGAEVHAFEPDPYNMRKAARALCRGRERASACSCRRRPRRQHPPDARRDLEHQPRPRLGQKHRRLRWPEHRRGRGDRRRRSSTSRPSCASLSTAHGRVAFVKLDIEGAELDLLEAMLAEQLFDAYPADRRRNPRTQVPRPAPPLCRPARDLCRHLSADPCQSRLDLTLRNPDRCPTF